MLARYAHIRVQARREAIATLERRTEFVHPFEDRSGRAQNWAQFSPVGPALPNHQSGKALNLRDFSLVGAAGFEPATTRTPSVCATSLRHAPTWHEEQSQSSRRPSMPRQYNRSRGVKTTTRFVGRWRQNVGSTPGRPIRWFPQKIRLADYGFFRAAATRGRHCQ
jgi:hypothetical protein